MSSRMKDYLRFVTVINTGHTLCVAHTGNDRHDAFGAVNAAQFAVNLINAVFALAQQNQSRRFHLHYLTAKLGPNGAAGSGHHDTFAFQIARNLLYIENYRIAFQQIFDSDRAQGLHINTLFQQGINAGNNLGFTFGLTADIYDGSNLSRRQRRYRDDNFFDAVFSDCVCNGVPASEHFDTKSKVVEFRGIIINKADYTPVIRMILLDISRHQVAGIASADNEYRNSVSILFICFSHGD